MDLSHQYKRHFQKTFPIYRIWKENASGRGRESNKKHTAEDEEDAERRIRNEARCELRRATH
jgi:hypothetical protein